MINLSPEFCRKIREARRLAKIGQVELSIEVGCKQSALSAFENGDGTKLNDEVINKLAKKFKVDILTREGEAASAVERVTPVHAAVGSLIQQTIIRGYCPNAHCPSNHGYEVDGRLLLRPDRTMADPVGGKFCAVCGDVLIKRCPNCAAPVHDGAICSICGDAYISL